jgi:hypothetical protein
MLAADHGFSVASVNYGGLTWNSERALARAGPIVATTALGIAGQGCAKCQVFWSQR